MANRPVLWIPRHLSEATLKRARETYEVILKDRDTPGTADEIIAMSAEADAFMPCHSEVLSADVVAQLGSRMKIVANHSVGVDHCDLTALAARGIVVTNTPDVLSDAAAELTLMLMQGAARRAVEGDRLVRTGAWDSWGAMFMVGKQVTGSRLGIIGLGRVGRALAKKARGLDMEIHYYDFQRMPPEIENGAVFHDTLESLLPVSDFLSLHCPSTPETLDLMNAERFNLLPDGAVFVNAARGSLVDEEALLQAIESGKLAGAGLDCFKVEPGGNPKMAEHQNIFMMPHVGSATMRTRDAMGFRALDNLDAFFAGQTPRDVL